MWFVVNDTVEWTPDGKKYPIHGTIVEILAPGTRAEDVLDENERTRISTKDVTNNYRPVRTRALVKVVDTKGYITYHTPKLTELTILEKACDKVEPTIQDVMKEIREIKERMRCTKLITLD